MKTRMYLPESPFFKNSLARASVLVLISVPALLLPTSIKTVSLLLATVIITVFFRLSAHAQISAQGLFFTVRGGMANTTVMKNS